MTASSEDTPTQEAALPSGGLLQLCRFENNVLEVRSDKAYPPGAPISFTWRENTLEGRSIGSKRVADDAFSVRIRMVSLKRTERDALLETLSDA